MLICRREVACVEVSDNVQKGIDGIGGGRITYVKIENFNFEAPQYALIDHKKCIISQESPQIQNSWIKSIFFQGGLLGGCLESLYDVLTNSRYEDEKEVCERYDLFPNKEEWVGKILFIETCEEKPTPELFEREVLLLKEKGVFDVVKGVLVGKPQDEAYYQEYKDILIRVIDNEKLPIVYNVNFGHAMPRCALQYGAVAKVDMKQKKIYVNR